jgi:hypothetical protein
LGKARTATSASSFRIFPVAPNAELYDAKDGFPVPRPFLARLKGNPFEPKYRVGEGNRSSPEDYLSRNPVTGLLIARDNRILNEHYQYGRTDRGRLLS